MDQLTTLPVGSCCHSRLVSMDAVMVHPPRACAAASSARRPSISHPRCSPRSPKAPRIRGYSTGGDCRQRFGAIRWLGVPESRQAGQGRAKASTSRSMDAACGFQRPSGLLDAGNSGSTIRMLSGILAAQPFATSITGDDSLRRRPMRRIIVPLERMGARILSEDGRPPRRSKAQALASTHA